MLRRIMMLAAFAALSPSVVWAQEHEHEAIPSAVTVFGHPVHPMLVAFPLALFATGLLFDLIYVGKKDDFWSRAALWVLLLGFIGGAAAAIPGFIDYYTVLPGSGEVHETAEIHWQLNVAVLAVFGVNLLIRTRPKARSLPLFWLPFGLTLLGVVLVMISGYYGGDLVFEHLIGVDPE